MAALEKSRDSDNNPSFVGRRLDDITDVWPLLSIPQENQGFIARFVSQMDVVSFVVRLNYVKAERRSPGASLRINSGFTEGFRSEAEVLEFVGTVERWENRRGLWSISHPRSQRRTRDAVPRQEPRTWGTCPTCFQLLPATGQCDNCEG